MKMTTFALVLAFALTSCASHETTTYCIDATVTQVGDETSGEPPQYLVTCKVDDAGETLIFPRLITLEGQEATAFVGECGDEGQTGLECRTMVTRNDGTVQASLRFCSYREGHERFIAEQLVAVKGP